MIGAKGSLLCSDELGIGGIDELGIASTDNDGVRFY